MSEYEKLLRSHQNSGDRDHDEMMIRFFLEEYEAGRLIPRVIDGELFSEFVFFGQEIVMEA